MLVQKSYFYHRLKTLQFHVLILFLFQFIVYSNSFFFGVQLPSKFLPNIRILDLVPQVIKRLS